MYRLPEKVRQLVPYQPITGHYTVRLDANESFLEPSQALREEISRAVAALDFNRYPDPYATALCEKFAAAYGVEPDAVVAGNGSDELIGLIVSSFSGPNETMAVVSPDFSMYAFYAQMNGTAVAVFEKDPSSLALDADALIAFVREKGAGLLMLSNPCNPTSLAASRADILGIIQALPDCLVVIDEAYMDFSEGSILTEAAQYDNLIVLKTCSKALGMAAIRLGFAVSGKALTRALKAAKSPYNVNSMTQAAGCALFGHPTYLSDCVRQIKASRNALYQALLSLSAHKKNLLEVYNTQANFIFLRVEVPEQLFQRLGARGIAVRHLGDFLRISAGSARENEALLSALEELLQ